MKCIVGLLQPQQGQGRSRSGAEVVLANGGTHDFSDYLLFYLRSDGIDQHSSLQERAQCQRHCTLGFGLNFFCFNYYYFTCFSNEASLFKMIIWTIRPLKHCLL